MPDMDGLGVLEKIREKDRNVPFIILSSHGTVPLAAKAVKKGATYFHKPFAQIEVFIIKMKSAFLRVSFVLSPSRGVLLCLKTI